jgi:osmotically-inducible protein OsmY
MFEDSKLKKAVLAALGWEPSMNSAHIGVIAKSGVITLLGRVESVAQKQAAEITASQVWGVEAVIEQLTVGRPIETEQSDDEIATAVIVRLARDVSVLGDGIKVRVEKGWVTLTGEVDSYYHKLALDQDVRGLHGVVGLSDQITVRPDVNVSNVTAK